MEKELHLHAGSETTKGGLGTGNEGFDVSTREMEGGIGEGGTDDKGLLELDEKALGVKMGGCSFMGGKARVCLIFSFGGNHLGFGDSGQSLGCVVYI